MGDINEQASRWVARLDGRVTPEEQREFEAWLEADERHRGAYARALAYWVRLDRFAALSSGKATDLEQAAVSSLGRRQVLAAGVAALLATGGTASWWFLSHRDKRRALLRQRPGLTQRYISHVGEIRRIVLNDGTVALLNTASELLVQFAEYQRSVRILAGEILFDVAHDNTRPFIAQTASLAVRAVGTTFDVRVDSDRVDVTVTEGMVDVAGSEVPIERHTVPAASQLARVAAFQQAIVDPSNKLQVRSITPADASRKLAWREERVSFSGESLQTAVAEINRYNRRKIIVDDLALSAKPVVGVFSVSDLDGFAAAAAAALKARAVSEGNVIRLQSDRTATQN